MPRRSVSEQVAPQIVMELAANTKVTQPEIEKRLEVARETVSRRMNRLETLGLAVSLTQEKRNIWRPSISCLLLAHSWLAVEDPLNPGIDRIAKEHRDRWLIYRKYSFLKEDPRVLNIVNNNVYIHLPFPAWRSREGFARTYEPMARSIEILWSHPVEKVREVFSHMSFDLSPEQLNRFTRYVLGWSAFIESITYTDAMQGFMTHLLMDEEIKEYFASQMHIEDKRYALLQEFRKQFLGGTHP